MNELSSCLGVASINTSLGILVLLATAIFFGIRSGNAGARVIELDQENKSLKNRLKIPTK